MDKECNVNLVKSDCLVITYCLVITEDIYEHGETKLTTSFLYMGNNVKNHACMIWEAQRTLNTKQDPARYCFAGISHPDQSIYKINQIRVFQLS